MARNFTPKCCNICVLNPICKKEYYDTYDGSVCQNARNELAYHLYRNHKSYIVFERYGYDDDIFNPDSIKYIKEKLKICRPKKLFRNSTIKRIKHKQEVWRQENYEGLREQIYGTDQQYMWTGDAPGYKG